MFFFIISTTQKLSPPSLTYEQYCNELLLGDPIKDWALEEDNGFAAKLQDPKVRERLVPSLQFFTPTPFGYLEHGQLYCQYIFPYVTQRPIILKYTRPLPKTFIPKPEEPPAQLHKRTAQWQRYYYGHIHYQLGIKLCFMNDYTKAVRYLTCATAIIEDGDLFYALGRLHEDGVGTKKEIHQALCYYQKAADLGHQKAHKKIQELLL